MRVVGNARAHCPEGLARRGKGERGHGKSRLGCARGEVPGGPRAQGPQLGHDSEAGPRERESFGFILFFFSSNSPNQYIYSTKTKRIHTREKKNAGFGMMQQTKKITLRFTFITRHRVLGMRKV